MRDRGTAEPTWSTQTGKRNARFIEVHAHKGLRNPATGDYSPTEHVLDCGGQPTRLLTPVQVLIEQPCIQARGRMPSKSTAESCKMARPISRQSSSVYCDIATFWASTSPSSLRTIFFLA